jgi:cbb3-type cytochrome oxidase maturation protein
MSVILILILASLAVALAFLGGFIWAVKSGQFEDTCTPAMRILSEDETVKQNVSAAENLQGAKAVKR